MSDKLIRVICISNKGDSRLIIYKGDSRLIIYKQYKALKYPRHNLYCLYDDNDYKLGLFPCSFFKEIKQIRKDRLNDILK